MTFITATGIGRPQEKFKLGERVRYHHRACEMRLPKPQRKSGDPFDAASPFISEWISCGPGRADHVFTYQDRLALYPDDLLGDRFVFRAPAGVNKSIAIWPEEGEGILISLVRRGIGKSVPTTSSHSLDSYDDIDPGYFAAAEWVWFYVVKFGMSGLDDLALVPMGALEGVKWKGKTRKTQLLTSSS